MKQRPRCGKFRWSGEKVIIGVNRQPLELCVDRQRSRATAFHKDYPGRHSGPVRWRDGKVTMRVLFDRSVVEVFANEGEASITDRVYPTQPLDRLELLSAGSASTSARS